MGSIRSAARESRLFWSAWRTPSPGSSPTTRAAIDASPLERIKESGSIFFARADEPWVLSGANVHISYVAQDDGAEQDVELNGQPVDTINADLTTGVDVTTAGRLCENAGIAFYADVKGGPFEIDEAMAQRLLVMPNPDGRPNADVVRRWANGLDVTRRPRNMWIIDFGVDMPADQAALYEAPFEYVRDHVRPIRSKTRRATYRDRWWLHAEPIPGMRGALKSLSRYIATPATAKHRLFVWMDRDVLPDHALVVFAREDDYTLGVLQSRVHAGWALATGTHLETRPRYTPTTSFETFPFPDATADQASSIALAAARLVALRNGWLTATGPNEQPYERTLTLLYNERPAWLENAHRALDDAVLEAYGWPKDISDDGVLAGLLALNAARVASGR